MINVLGLIVLNVIVFQKKNLSFIVMSVGMATRGSGACFSLSPASAPIPTIYDMAIWEMDSLYFVNYLKNRGKIDNLIGLN
jgi:hypothetical protein